MLCAEVGFPRPTALFPQVLALHNHDNVFLLSGQLQRVKELIPYSLSKSDSHLANGYCENGSSVCE